MLKFDQADGHDSLATAETIRSKASLAYRLCQRFCQPNGKPSRLLTLAGRNLQSSRIGHYRDNPFGLPIGTIPDNPKQSTLE